MLRFLKYFSCTHVFTVSTAACKPIPRYLRLNLAFTMLINGNSMHSSLNPYQGTLGLTLASPCPQHSSFELIPMYFRVNSGFHFASSVYSHTECSATIASLVANLQKKLILAFYENLILRIIVYLHMYDLYWYVNSSCLLSWHQWHVLSAGLYPVDHVTGSWFITMCTLITWLFPPTSTWSLLWSHDLSSHVQWIASPLSYWLSEWSHVTRLYFAIH